MSRGRGDDDFLGLFPMAVLAVGKGVNERDGIWISRSFYQLDDFVVHMCIVSVWLLRLGHRRKARQRSAMRERGRER